MIQNIFFSITARNQTITEIGQRPLSPLHPARAADQVTDGTTRRVAPGARYLQSSTLGLALFTIPPCSADGANWQCYLPWILYILYALAFLLSLVLVVVVAMAIRSYLKKKADLKVGP